jgi:hypothetical protein
LRWKKVVKLRYRALAMMCQATRYKDEGNDEYKRGNWLKAAALYTKVRHVSIVSAAEGAEKHLSQTNMII